MKQLVIGVLAHVDAGKTTLSEALLYTAGAIPTLGRVDHRDAYLDTHDLERARGITIFSKQALFRTEGMAVTLLDTPGHVDFSTEMERTLQVLDYAILVISATDGVQAHTETLWRLLRRNHIPTFLFVTKMDLPNPGREPLLAGLQKGLDEGCLDFTTQDQTWAEAVALREEGVLERYLDTGTLSPRDVSGLIRLGKVTPVFFGSALHLEGVEAFLQGLETFTEAPAYGEAFAARVFKIARDHQGNRLTYLKVTGGTLSVRAPLTYLPRQGEEGVEEKVTQLRLYSGAKFQTVDTVSPGQVCAALGLTQTYPGQGLGAATPAPPPLLEPVVTYRLLLPEEVDPKVLLPKLRQLEEEDPQLHLVWDQAHQEIHAHLMGQVQIEVLQRLIQDRFGVAVGVDQGRILYKETIAAPVEGVGHYEPLRHYAEVHLLLEPLPQGSGLVLATRCSEDVLAGHWQRLILTHLAERTHRGVLTGAPITDLKITLMSGRAHPKHTEGGDFRQATYRAVRQGLMGAQSVLLEPWYEFTLTLPADQLGRAISDLQTMGGTFASPESDGEWATLTGTAPVSEMKDYPLTMAAYTRGRGEVLLLPPRLRPLPQPEAGGGRRRLRPGAGSGTHPGLGVLRPRRGLYGEVGPGAPVHAPGKLPHPGPEGGGPRPRPPGVHPEPGHRREGAGGHLPADLRPPAPPGVPVPGPGAPPSPGGHHRAPQAAVPHRGRVQHDLRLGRAEGPGQGKPGRRPPAAHGHSEQLRRLQGLPPSAGL